MRCVVVLVCLPAVPCLPRLAGLPVCCLLACLLAFLLRWTRHILERAFDQGSAWVDQEADCWLAGYFEDCDMRRTPTRLCNYRPVPLGLLARAAGEQEANLA